MPDQGHQPHDRAGRFDPLVDDGPADFGRWLGKVGQVARQSWRGLLTISTVGVVLPAVIISLTAETMMVNQYLPPYVGDTSWLMRQFPGAIVGLSVTAVVACAALYVVCAALTASVWTVVEESATGQSVGVLVAFRVGFGRARSMWYWLVAVGLAVAVGLTMCTVPGVYVAYACSMFGFVVIFEPRTNPVSRSVGLTHRRIGVASGRVLASLVPCALCLVTFELLANTTFKVAFGFGAMTGTTTEAGVIVLRALMILIKVVLFGPAVAALVLGLFMTYVELRADEAPLTTEGLRAELAAGLSSATSSSATPASGSDTTADSSASGSDTTADSSASGSATTADGRRSAFPPAD